MPSSAPCRCVCFICQRFDTLETACCFAPKLRLIAFYLCALQPRPEPDGLPHRASHDRPADVWIPHGKDMIPEAWDSAVTSSLRPATRNPGPTTTPTQNLAEHENLKRTLHDTANRCHRSGLRFTQCSSMVTQEAGETRHTTWSSGSLTDSPPPLSAHQSTPVSNWLSASLACHVATCSAGCLKRRLHTPRSRPLVASLG